VPVFSKNWSARVDFPWSMWAMMQKFRMFAVGVGIATLRSRKTVTAILAARARPE
jgi:hypothetical protein